MSHSLPSLTGLTLNDVEPVGMRAPKPEGVSDELWLRVHLKASQPVLRELSFEALAKWLIIDRGPDLAPDMLVQPSTSITRLGNPGPLKPPRKNSRTRLAQTVLDKAILIQSQSAASPDRAARAAVAVINAEAREEIEAIKKATMVKKMKETRERKKEEKQKREQEKLEPPPPPPPRSDADDADDAEERSDTVEL